MAATLLDKIHNKNDDIINIREEERFVRNVIGVAYGGKWGNSWFMALRKFNYVYLPSCFRYGGSIIYSFNSMSTAVMYF